MGIGAMVDQAAWNEAQEMAIYRPGQKVEIKLRPGLIDTIIAYDPMMVPPVILASDPQPRYPEELNLVAQPAITFDWLRPWSKTANNPASRTVRSVVKA
jgi:hypothetical protein